MTIATSSSAHPQEPEAVDRFPSPSPPPGAARCRKQFKTIKVPWRIAILIAAVMLLAGWHLFGVIVTMITLD